MVHDYIRMTDEEVSFFDEIFSEIPTLSYEGAPQPDEDPADYIPRRLITGVRLG